jgi:hypothetical protein
VSSAEEDTDSGALPPNLEQRIAVGLLGASAPLAFFSLVDVPFAGLIAAGYVALLTIALWRVRPVAGKAAEFRLWTIPFLLQGTFLTILLFPIAAARISGHSAPFHKQTSALFGSAAGLLTILAFLPALILYAAGRRGLMLVLVTTVYPGVVFVLAVFGLLTVD